MASVFERVPQEEDNPTDATPDSIVEVTCARSSIRNDYSIGRIVARGSRGCMILFVGIVIIVPFLQFVHASSSSSLSSTTCKTPCVLGDESLMDPKEHGTSSTPVQSNLRWGCDWNLADHICNYNRHYAEPSGYWLQSKISLSSNIQELEAQQQQQQQAENNGAKKANTTTLTFYDSNTGNPLFRAPMNRSWKDFVDESTHHGWPSFRDEEVNWEYVRVLKNGETVSIDGTHLGHNLPDSNGNRYCINLVSVAGRPQDGGDEL